MSKSAKQTFSKEQYLHWFELMMLVRRFEEKAAQLYGQQKIKGFCHLYIGQEAIVAGMASAITKDDAVITAYRDHGHALAQGISADAVMAELYGKATGCTKGKGGSMHMFSKEHNFYGGHGIVGGQIPLGAGIALAEQYRGTNFRGAHNQYAGYLPHRQRLRYAFLPGRRYDTRSGSRGHL